MVKRVLVTGKSGQLGQSVQKKAKELDGFHFTFVGRNELDLADLDSLETYFEGRRFDYIVNCAAYTAVDQAESEPELAEQVNHQAVKKLAEIAKASQTVLIQISTDYVFNGQHFKPYLETDSVDPQSVYGLTKLKGEEAIREIGPEGFIIRTSWVYSEFGHNFVKTMLRLGRERERLNVIFDQVGTPTYAGDLANAVLDILLRHSEDREQPSRLDQGGSLRSNKANPPEVYHFSNEGVCSWYDFAQAIFELSGTECRVSPIETKEYPTPAKRPPYSLLNKAKIKQGLEREIPFWRDSLKQCLKTLQETP